MKTFFLPAVVVLAWTAVVPPRVEADTVRAGTVRDFLRAVKSDREIVLAAGVYDLSSAANVSRPSFAWNEVYDGKELVVKNVKDLVIRGENGAGVEIVTSPRYAFVLSFVNCAGIKLENLKIGHKEGGECTGGVVRFNDAVDVTIDKCELYGSGTIGIEAVSVKNLLVTESVITGCSYGAAAIDNCDTVQFETSEIRGNEGYPLVSVTVSRDVSFRGCSVAENRGSAVFTLDAGSVVVFSEGFFRNNETDTFCEDGRDNLYTEDSVFEGNSFPAPDEDDGDGEGGGPAPHEVVLDFAGAAFYLPDDWTHELHDDVEGSATFASSDGEAFGFFFPLDAKEGRGDVRAFAAGKNELENLFTKNVGFSLNLKASGNPETSGEIRRQSFRGSVIQDGKTITVKVQLLAIHGRLCALVLLWLRDPDFEAEADGIFDSVRQLEAAG